MLVEVIPKRVYLKKFLNLFVSSILIDYFFSYSNYSREYITCLSLIHTSPSSHTFFSQFLLSKVSSNYCLFLFCIPFLHRLSNHLYGVVRITLSNSGDAVKVTTELDGEIFHDVHLRVSQNGRPVHHTLRDTTLSRGGEEEKE